MLHAYLVLMLILSASPHPGSRAPKPANAREVLVDVQKAMPQVIVQMPYASVDNVSGVKLYPEARCLLRPPVVTMLEKAQAHLSKKAPGVRLLLKDCYRPLRAQKLLFESVAGTPQQPYVANPYRRYGSVHTYGAAVDITLADARGHELDMGTPFDFLGPLAEPRKEAACLRSKKLTQKQVNNRLLLREAMVNAGGFLMMSREWWHFDAWRGASLRSRYGPLDKPFSDFD